MRGKWKVFNHFLLIGFSLLLLLPACQSKERKSALQLVEEADSLYLLQNDISKRDASKAIKKYEEAIEILSDDADVVRKLALVLESIGEYTKAADRWVEYEIFSKDRDEPLCKQAFDRCDLIKNAQLGLDQLNYVKNTLPTNPANYENVKIAAEKAVDHFHDVVNGLENLSLTAELESRTRYDFAESYYYAGLTHLALNDKTMALLRFTQASGQLDIVLEKQPANSSALWLKASISIVKDPHEEQLKCFQAYRKAVPNPQTTEEKDRDNFAKNKINAINEYFRSKEQKELEEELDQWYARLKRAQELVYIWRNAKIEIEKTGKITNAFKTFSDRALLAYDVMSCWKQAGGWMADAVPGRSLADRTARMLGQTMVTTTTEGTKFSIDMIQSGLSASTANLLDYSYSFIAYKLFRKKIGAIKLEFDLREIESAINTAEMYVNHAEVWIQYYKEKLEQLKTPKIPLKLKTTLDPNQISSWEEQLIISQLFEGLVRMGSDNQIEPAGASSWQVSSDNRVFTFSLEENRVWSDGLPVTAVDYLYGMRRQLGPDVDGSWGYLLEVIAGSDTPDESDFGVKVLDEYTLEITTKEPCPQLLSILALAPAYPLREDIIEAFGDDWAKPPTLVCNGPFKVGEWVEGEEIVLVPNMNYWDTEAVTPDTLFFPIVGDYEQALGMLQNGEADIAILDDRLINAYGLQTQASYLPSDSTYYLSLNTKKYPLDDPMVRQAFARAIDRETLLARLEQPTSQIATGIVPPALTAFQGEDIGYVFDPDAATANLQAAGFYGGNLTITVLITEQNLTLFEFIADNWKEYLGVEVEFIKVSTPEFFDRLNGCSENLEACEFDVFGLGINTEYSDAYSFLKEWLPGNYASDESGWISDAYKDLLDNAQISTDAEIRTQYLQEAENLLVTEEVVAIPLYHTRRAYLTSEGTSGNWSPLGIPDLDQWDTEPEPILAEDGVSSADTIIPTTTPTTTATAVPATESDNGQTLDGSCLEYDIDRFGSDYLHLELAVEEDDPLVCLRFCLEDDGCKAFTYVSAGIQGDLAACWLKNDIPETSPMEGVISGVRNECLSDNSSY